MIMMVALVSRVFTGTPSSIVDGMTG